MGSNVDAVTNSGRLFHTRAAAMEEAQSLTVGSRSHLMPLPLTVSCFSKIQTGFTFLVPAHPGPDPDP